MLHLPVRWSHSFSQVYSFFVVETCGQHFAKSFPNPPEYTFPCHQVFFGTETSLLLTDVIQVGFLSQTADTVCLSVCLSVSLSLSLWLDLSLCPSLSVCLSLSLSVCLSVALSLSPCHTYRALISQVTGQTLVEGVFWRGRHSFRLEAKHRKKDT